MIFTKESDFENVLIEILSHKGWEKDVIKYPTEKDLIKNWSNILFDNKHLPLGYWFHCLCRVA